MKPIEELDLAELTKEADMERREELARGVRRKIGIILGAHYSARGSISDLERQLNKAKERLAKEQAKLAALEKGDWSILPEDGKQKEEQPEKDAV